MFTLYKWISSDLICLVGRAKNILNAFWKRDVLGMKLNSTWLCDFRSGTLGSVKRIPLLILLPGPLKPSVVVPVRYSSTCPIAFSIWTLFLLERNTWYHITVCKLFLWARNTWYYITLCKDLRNSTKKWL